MTANCLSRAFPCVAMAIALIGPAASQAQSPPTQQAAPTEEAMVDSPFFKVGWPKFEMPKFAWKPGGGDDSVAAPTGPTENPISRALDKVTATSRKASDGVRNAWGSAVGKLSSLGGGGDKASTRGQEEEPGFFARLFAPEEPRAPETMSEWIAQDRVGTTR